VDRAVKQLQVCGEAENGEDAVEKALRLNPDLIILDVVMPVLDGLAAARKIRSLLPNVQIVMLSMHDGAEILQAARLAGARGFVTKSEIAERLVEAVGTVLRGQTFFVERGRPGTSGP
jgi:DNA-binding NarL/FixJ family response regulator